MITAIQPISVSNLEQSKLWAPVPTSVCMELSVIFSGCTALINDMNAPFPCPLHDYAAFLWDSVEAGHEEQGQEPDGTRFSEFHERNPANLPAFLCVQLPGSREQALALANEVFAPIYSIQHEYPHLKEDIAETYESLVEGIDMLYDAAQLTIVEVEE